MKRLVLIDSDAIIHRAYHALPRFTNAQGKLINAVYGFTNIFVKIAQELSPDYLVAAFDIPKQTFRHELFKEYKGTRLKSPEELDQQIETTKELLRKLDVAVFAKEGVEADDIIGSIAKQAEEKGLCDEILIVTGDLDTLQLVTNTTHVYTMRKGIADVVIYDIKAVKERFGFAPEYIIDYKALRGDPSDNIPGVKGIGEKTAKELIVEYGTLEEIIDAAKKGKIKGKTRESILAQEDAALFSKTLATIKTDVPLEFNNDAAAFSSKNLNRLPDALRSMGLSFKSIVERLSQKPQTQKQKPAELNVSEAFPRFDAEKIDLQKPTVVLARDNTFYCRNNNENFCIPFDKLHSAKVFFETKESRLATFGGKAVLRTLIDAGISVRPFWHDLEIASWLLSPEFANYKLVFLVKKFIQGFFPLRSIRDELAAIEKLLPLIEKELETKGLLRVYQDIELPLTPILAKIESTGIHLETRTLEKLDTEVSKEIQKLEKEIADLTGETINLNSPKQLSVLLFEKLKLPAKGIRKTASGQLSTQESELIKLKTHPVIEKIINIRGLSKLKSNYIDALPKFIAADGKIRVNFLQTGTATGRLASSEPNLQNLPAGQAGLPIASDLSGRVREAFKAAAGYKFLAFDYSQIELRALAHLSEDPAMIEAFRNGEDIHRKTAAAVFGVSYKEVSEAQRQKAKMLNFGLIYGMGPRSFAENTGSTLSEAKNFMERYFIEFAGVKKFLDETKEKARTMGYVETPLGRKRWIGEIGAGSIHAEKRLERMAVNAPIQGFATGDLIKLAVIKIQEFLEQEKLYPETARMLLQIHDEILMEIQEHKSREIAPRIKEIMEHVYPLRVPLEVKIEIGDDFYRLSPLA